MVLEKISKVTPVISLWELYHVMATRVPIQSAQKPYTASLSPYT